MLILLLAVIWFFTVAQVGQNKRSYKSVVENKYNSEYKTLIDRTGIVYDWTLYGATCPGCASFYIKIMSDARLINGKYAYYVFLFSNSYNAYGYLAGTYIKGINIYKVNYNGIHESIMFVDYILINPKTVYFDGVNLGTMFYSDAPDDVIIITWKSSTVY